METPLQSAEATSNPVSSPEKLVGNITHNKDFLFIASLFALGFFAIYAYKTWLEIKVAKQELLLNEMMMNEDKST